MFLTGKITEINRLRSSAAGNPRFEIAIHPTNVHGYPMGTTAELHKTKANSTINFEITPGWLDKRFKFTLNERGEIIDAERK